jgi:uncharacterized membrane protein (UPF0127 family)
VTGLLTLLSTATLIFASDVTFKTQQIKINQKTLIVEVARTEAELARGLMDRVDLKGIDGMLFVFPYERRLSFWMKNTYIPLSIGFFNKEGVLIDIQDMEPVVSAVQKSIPQYESRMPALYALEVPRGWFKRQQIKVGHKLRLPIETKVQVKPKADNGK